MHPGIGEQGTWHSEDFMEDLDDNEEGILDA